MDTTRRDFSDRRSNDQAFKKQYQVVGRPEVAERDIHEDYVKNPPNNQPTEPMTDRRARGLKEGAREELDPKQEGVLGDEPIGKIAKQAELESMTQENAVHP
ncbi:hypothetical protein B0H21DRAFT_72328 [Amylocystis lapponica]|nr:hypothetical protein B0H21DRAFT_72328 [Amylocystis lapponica]